MSELESMIEIAKEYGEPIFAEVFALSDKELLEKIESICGEQLPDHILSNYGKGTWVTRVIKNEEPQSITIEYYDSVEINVFGISIKPEHGQSQKIITFNKHFKL